MSDRFKSERDTWLVILACGATAVTVIALIPLLVSNVHAGIRLIVASTLFLTVVLVLWIMFGTYYEFGNDELQVHSGPFRWRIPLRDIRSVSSTRAPWSSPALSLNRLRIDYGDGKWILVSPERPQEFVARLGIA